MTSPPPVAAPTTAPDADLATAPAQAALESNPGEGTRPVGIRLIGFLAALVVLLGAVTLSFLVGARSVSVDDVVRLLTHGSDGSFESIVVLDQRLPRTVAGLLAGCALGVAGALIQAVTRNPLADPGILGVNSGSAFAVAVSVGFLGLTSPLAYIWFAFGGALITTVAVYLIGAGGRGGSVSIARLTLAGVALSAVLLGITQALVIQDPESFDALRAWQAGSLEGRGWDVITPAAPFIVVGVLVALALGRPLNAVAMGDDLAASLGANVVRTRAFSVLAVTLLAGGATAIVGPIASIGLMVPHIARWITGPDQRWIMAFCVVLAPILLLVADVIARIALKDGELPAGVVTAALGALVLIVLVRRYRVSAL